MGVRLNPLSGNFDFTGTSDAAPFAGQVDAYADLPLGSTAALNSRWLVKNNSGTWPFSSYKQAGIYIRVNTAGISRDTDYQFVGTLPSVMNDNEFIVYDDTDATKNLKFNVGANVPTASTVTLTVPNANGTIARTEDFAAPPAIGNTTPAAGTFTTLTASTSLALTGGIITGASNVIEQVSSTSAQTFRLYNTQSGTGGVNFERLRLAWASNVAIIGTEKGGTGSARALEFQTDGVTRLTIASTGAATFAGGLSSVGINASGGSISTNQTLSLSSTSMSCAAIFGTLDIITNAAGLRLYGLGNNGGSATNTERLHISTRSGASYFISTQATGTGVARALEIRTADVARLTFEAAGGLTIADANDIAVGTTTGTKIGTGTTQKIGFFNATPVVQQAAVADATDAASTQARLNDLLARLRTLGLIAT